MQPVYSLALGAHNNHQQPPQRFMEDDCSCSSILPTLIPETLATYSYHHQHTNLQQGEEETKQRHHQQQQQHTHVSAPITHQLFQQQSFRFQQDEEENKILHRQQQHSSFSALNFKLGLGETTHQPHAIFTSHEQLFWKQLNGSEKHNEKLDKETQETMKGHYLKPWHTQDAIDESCERTKYLDTKYKAFNELEAICSLTKIRQNQTASGSAVTGENSPTVPNLSAPTYSQNVAAVNNPNGVDRISESLIQAEAIKNRRRKRKRKKRIKEKLTSMARFLRSFAKQVTDHQEMLYKRFLKVVEKIDKERTEREEAWRHQEAEKQNKEAISIAHEQALALSRESKIVSYIEKITGKSIDLPAREMEFSDDSIEHLTHINKRRPKPEVGSVKEAYAEILQAFIHAGKDIESAAVNMEVGNVGNSAFRVDANENNEEEHGQVKDKIGEEEETNKGDEGSDLHMEIDHSG